jgi:hypothetical protein
MKIMANFHIETHVGRIPARHLLVGQAIAHNETIREVARHLQIDESEVYSCLGFWRKQAEYVPAPNSSLLHQIGEYIKSNGLLNIDPVEEFQRATAQNRGRRKKAVG